MLRITYNIFSFPASLLSVIRCFSCVQTTLFSPKSIIEKAEPNLKEVQRFFLPRFFFVILEIYAIQLSNSVTERTIANPQAISRLWVFLALTIAIEYPFAHASLILVAKLIGDWLI